MSEQQEVSGLIAEAPVALGPSVGARLRAAREARGISLHEIANTLKLGARQVEGLEKGDWQALPGHTFIRGFVRNYARLVELDTAPLMAELDRILEKPQSKLERVEGSTDVLPSSGGKISRRDRNVILAGLAAVTLAAAVYFVLPNDLSALRDSLQGVIDSVSRKEEAAPPAEAEAAAPAAAPVDPVLPPGTTPQQVLNPQVEAPVAPPALEAAPASAVEKRVEPAEAGAIRFVFDKESWVEVRDRDNKPVFSQRSASGSEQWVSGKGPFSLVIGYAPGVRLFWHGQAIDLVPHTRGDVARLILE